MPRSEPMTVTIQIDRGDRRLLERIVDALEQLVELERTEPLEKIIHPSFLRERQEEE